MRPTKGTRAASNASANYKRQSWDNRTRYPAKCQVRLTFRVHVFLTTVFIYLTLLDKWPSPTLLDSSSSCC